MIDNHSEIIIACAKKKTAQASAHLSAADKYCFNRHFA